MRDAPRRPTAPHPNQENVPFDRQEDASNSPAMTCTVSYPPNPGYSTGRLAASRSIRTSIAADGVTRPDR